VPALKHTVKDSIFTTLFGNPRNALELYKCLHPEDKTVSVDDCKIVTLETILAAGIYNDLGLQVRDCLIILVEAQSTFSYNIMIRILLYLANTYKEYATEHKISLYSTTLVKIPRPELFIVYTGKQNDIPAVLRFSDLFMYSGKENGFIEIEAKVIREAEGLLGQYIDFCRISDEQRALHGRTEKAAKETIRICLERGILVPLLTERQREVVDMLNFLFTQEEVDEIERYNARKEGLAEGLEKGLKKGQTERDIFYGKLMQILAPLGRIDDLVAATSDKAKLAALAKEFGLEV